MSKKALFIILGCFVAFCVAMMCCFLLFNNKQQKNNIFLNFADKANISQYETKGFFAPEKSFSWINGKEASIVIPVEISEDNAFKMSVEAKPFIAKKIKKQVVDVFVNETKVAKWAIEKDGTYTAFIPHEIIKDKMNIKFTVSNPKSPKELGLSKDSRKLGLAIKNIKLNSVDAYNPDSFTEYKLGSTISFEYGGNSEDYIGTGWSDQEKHARWTDGKDAYVNLFIKDVKDKNLQLLMSGRGMVAPEKEYQPITLYVNDKEVAVWKVTGEHNTYSVMLPESVLGTGALKIRLHIDAPVSPGVDKRLLGFFAKEIRIREPVGVRTKVKVALWLKNKVLKNVKGSAEENPDNI